MAQFQYKARRRDGQTVTGVLEVADRSAALMQIERLGLFPVAVEAPKGGAAAIAAAAAAAGKPSAKSGSWTEFLPPNIRVYFERQRKPKLQELATFTNQMANLLKSGMPLTVALNSMTHLETKGISSEVSRQLKQEVTEGKGLSEAMAKQPVIFSSLYVNMVKAGEQSGALVDVLRRMGDHFERFAEVEAKFKSAMIYPAFVCCVGIAISIFFMTVMLPSFMKLFQGMNIELPLMTRILIGLNDFIKRWLWVGVGLAIAIGIIVNRFRASENGKRTIDRWRMTAPIFGKVMRLHIFAQFARTLSTLLHNGVPVLTALEITEQIIENSIVRAAIASARQEVTDGKTLAQPLARSKIFPQLMVDLIKIGEDTGDVPGSLANLADTYESELHIALRVMTNMIEPVIICIMAMGVGFLLVSILSALFAMTSQISAKGM
ncbi:MAG TPA: type II secretion system F family protein [Verrucomicrobiae bacterium]|jgi:type II secretory pathway component PulF|nr:type II secretion system F family protein [Verrucomicrobiae bacterium]